MYPYSFEAKFDLFHQTSLSQHKIIWKLYHGRFVAAKFKYHMFSVIINEWEF